MKHKILIGLLFSFLFGCKKDIPDQLSGFIATELKKDNGVLDISKFNEVEWDKLYIVMPYAYPLYYDKLLSRYEREILATNIDDLDNKHVLLLFKNAELVSLSDVNLSVINFREAIRFNEMKILPYAKKEAIFQYRNNNKGYREVILRKN